jgi:hypothetical protein
MTVSYHTRIELVTACDARPGRVVVVKEEGSNEEVKGAHGDGGVLVRQPRGRCPRSPIRLGVHPLDGAAVELAGEDEKADEQSARASRICCTAAACSLNTPEARPISSKPSTSSSNGPD